MLRARFMIVMLFAVSLLMLPSLAQADWTGYWIVEQDTFDTNTFINGGDSSTAGDNLDGWADTLMGGAGFGWSGMGNPVSGGGSGPGAMGTNRAAYVNKAFDVVPGAIYELSFAVAVEYYGSGVNWLCPPVLSHSLWFRYNWGVGNPVNSYQVPITLNPCPRTDTFKTVSTTFTVPAGVTEMEIYIWPGMSSMDGGRGIGADLYWDDITLAITYYPGDASDVPSEVRLAALEAAVAGISGGLTSAQVLALIDGSIDNDSSDTIGTDVAGMISAATSSLATKAEVTAVKVGVNAVATAHNTHVHDKGSSNRNTSGPSVSVYPPLPLP